ncbi:hypothetical protein [Clostridium fessum]|uniref:hypothetical protein n=1 Tax=Clostridium fessum TaxID=2126740 RepID=UPI0039999DF0
MKIQTDEDILSGSALEIMEQFRMRTFDPGEFADTETYLWFLQHNFVRMTGMDCPLPAGSVEQQASVMLYALAKVGALTILEDGE